MTDLRNAILASDASEILERAAFVTGEFGLVGQRVDATSGVQWELDIPDVARAICEFAAANGNGEGVEE